MYRYIYIDLYIYIYIYIYHSVHWGINPPPSKTPPSYSLPSPPPLNQ